MTHLNTADDLQWLADVHKVPTEGIAVAIIYGNEDAPQRVETYRVDDRREIPELYVQDDSGALVKQRPAVWAELWDAMLAHPDAWIETTQEMTEAQRDCVPPAAMARGAFLVGEPWSHNEQGKAVYACFCERSGRYYGKRMTRDEFNRTFRG